MSLNPHRSLLLLAHHLLLLSLDLSGKHQLPERKRGFSCYYCGFETIALSNSGIGFRDDTLCTDYPYHLLGAIKVMIRFGSQVLRIILDFLHQAFDSSVKKT
jgi:hypothetical protein